MNCNKLVCMDADYFLATPKGCGRAQSTYTTMIIDARKASMQLGLDIKIMTLRLSMVPSQITIDYLVNGNARVD